MGPGGECESREGVDPQTGRAGEIRVSLHDGTKKDE